MAEIKKKLTIIFLAIFMCSLFSLTGCKDPEKEQAVAEAAAAKIELSKVKNALSDIVSERDNLKLKLTTAIEARDKLQDAIEKAKDIKEKLTVLTKERDTAIAKLADTQGIVEKLKSRVAEQVQKVAGLEGQNKKLQGIIAELKENLGGEVEMPSIPKL